MSAVLPARRVRADLPRRILSIAQARGLKPGARLTELGLAGDLNVSRTPIRQALQTLEDEGWVAPGPSRGYVLRRAVRSLPAERNGEDDAEGGLYVAIAGDRLAGKLADSVSESDMLRRYDVPRSLLLRVLGRLAEGGVIERRPGYGWQFRPTIDDAASHQESYRFRLLIEPAALLEPGFRLDRTWLADMRQQHQRALARPWRATSSIAFYEMNAAFHEGLAAASGNRFLLLAMQQQNRLRRFSNVAWTYGHARVAENCREHLAMLDRLEAGDNEIAALMMRRHLEGAAVLLPQAFADQAAGA